MIRLISSEKAKCIIGRYGEWIQVVAQRYGIPSALIKAILYQEMTQIDVWDVVADGVVRMGVFGKKDSSVGYAQIFGWVGLNAINFAVDHGFSTYEALGLDVDHRLDAENAADVRTVWLKLHEDPRANIEIAALNLLMIADEITGQPDYKGLSEEQLKLILTRYNANVKHVTSYGEQAYRYYREFLEA